VYHSNLTRVRADPLSPVVGQSDFTSLGCLMTLLTSFNPLFTLVPEIEPESHIRKKQTIFSYLKRYEVDVLRYENPLLSGMKPHFYPGKSYFIPSKRISSLVSFFSYLVFLFHNLYFCFIPQVSISYLKFLFHTIVIHTLNIIFIPLRVFSYLPLFIPLGVDFIPKLFNFILLDVFFIR